MNKKTIKDVVITGKAVLMRGDYNVSIKGDGAVRSIVDDTRIVQSLPTIEYILSQKPKRLVLMSHLGEPKGRDDQFSLNIVADRLSTLLKRSVVFISDYTSEEGRQRLGNLQNGEVVLLENVRFNEGETTNHPGFCQQLAILGELFVNDAFGSSHRAHASVVGVASILPAVAGLLLDREITIIGNALEKPETPFVVVLGGAKATTKIPMIERLMTKADYMLLGGGVANTFLKALGYEIGKSVFSPESLRLCQNLIWRATRVNTRVFLPSDVVVGNFSSGINQGEVDIESIPIQFQALDIGKHTQEDFAHVISTAKTIIWNGPMGANELPAFMAGTKAVYDAIVANTNSTSIVGGGDTLTSIQGQDHLKNITHISTGGGAMLEFIEKGTLPGVEVLQDK